MDGGEWISITEAAARLTKAGDLIERSALSRYVSQHSEALATKREGKANLIEFASLVAHRAENVRLRKPTLPLTAGPAATSEKPSRFAGSQSDGAARKAQADAKMREMDLAERLGDLTIVDEVDKAGRDAMALMQSAFERAVDTDAATASVKYGWDERLVRLVLKGFARKGVDVFHSETLKYLDSLERKRLAAQQGDTMPAEATQALQ